MYDENEDFSPLVSKRSSDFVTKIWYKIEKHLIKCMGMCNLIKLYCCVDREDITILIEDEFNNEVIPAIEEKNHIRNDILDKILLSFDIQVIIVNSHNDFYINVDDCNYYFFPREDKTIKNIEDDDGTIFFEARASCSIQKIQNLKHEFVKRITKESQYALNDIVLKKNINNNFYVELDSKIEQIISLSIINNITFKDSLKLFADEIFISDEELKIINQTFEGNL